MNARLFVGIALATGLAWLGTSSCYAPELGDCMILCGGGGDCPDGMTCSNGYCSARSGCGRSGPDASGEREAPCSPGTLRCESASRVERCSEDGSSWVTDRACDDANPTCHAGRCQACAPGSIRCEDSGHRRWCDAAGEWDTTSVKCPTFAPRCHAGQCEPELIVTAGGAHACALTTAGTLQCWGDNASGQLGASDTARRGGAAEDPPLATADLGPGALLDVSAGGAHTCALLAGGAIKCWGENTNAELGLDDRRNRGDDSGEMGEQLAAVAFGPDRTPTGVSAGGRHTCALFSDGRITCWGANESGQLGRNDKASSPRPADAKAPFANVDLGRDERALQLDAGEAHTCALLTGGTVKCWGNNEAGQLGVGDRNARGDEPGELGDQLRGVPLPEGVPAVQVTAGGDHSCALLADASIVCWGDNSAGQLGTGGPDRQGDGGPADAAGLIRVDLGTGVTALEVSAGSNHSCALLGDRRIKCWGINHFGTLGLGAAGAGLGNDPGELGDALPPVPLGADDAPGLASRVSAGTDFSCVALEGSVRCFGQNARGQLGVGDTDSRGDDPNELGDALPEVQLPP